MILLFTALHSGCTGVPDGVQVVTGFELDRYLGTWYEIARLDHRFERGMSNVTAHYSMRDDGGVNVTNRGYNVTKSEWDEATGKAYFVGDTDVGPLTLRAIRRQMDIEAVAAGFRDSFFAFGFCFLLAMLPMLFITRRRMANRSSDPKR